MPKLYTITRYGKKIILTNSAYIDTISNTRVWLCEKILELLEIRIQCYTDLEGQFEKGTDSVAETGGAFPVWFSETLSGYWDIAGLPRSVSGVFFGPWIIKTEQASTTLSFTPIDGHENTGWFFSLGDDTSASIFIASRKSAKTIYERKGKTPAEQTLRLEGTLFFDAGGGNEIPGENFVSGGNFVSDGVAQTIIERSLAPFVRDGQKGIDVTITFDGTNFEIREYPPMHNNAVIFRGTGNSKPGVAPALLNAP